MYLTELPAFVFPVNKGVNAENAPYVLLAHEQLGVGIIVEYHKVADLHTLFEIFEFYCFHILPVFCYHNFSIRPFSTAFS